MRSPILRFVLVLILPLLVLTGGCEKGTGKVAKKRPPEISKEALKLAKCKDDGFRLDLLGVLDTLPDDTPSAHLEQLRDWVWTALLARVAALNGEPELLAGTVRQPFPGGLPGRDPEKLDWFKKRGQGGSGWTTPSSSTCSAALT